MTHPFPKPVSTVNYGPQLLVTVWVVTGLSIVAVVLRSVSNYKFGNFQLSDLVTLFGLVCPSFLLSMSGPPFTHIDPCP